MTHAKLKPGRRAPAFDLPTTDGGRITLDGLLHDRRGAVVLFICNHCPYVQAYIPRLIDLQRQFASIGFVGICSNDAATYPEDAFPAMQEAARTWGLNFPYAHDENQDIARAYGAERTPEVFALDATGVCRFEGGIDDNFQNASAVTERPLHDALAAIVAGRPVKRPHTWAIGCTIKWKDPAKA